MDGVRYVAFVLGLAIVFALRSIPQIVSWFKNLFGKKTDAPPAETITIRGGALTLSPVKPDRAKAEWLRRRRSTTGTSVIIVEPYDHAEVKEDAADGSPDEILSQAAEIDVTKFFADRHQNFEEDEDEDMGEDWAIAHQEPDPTKLKRAKNPFKEFAGATFEKQTYLAEIPCSAPWQVLAHFPFGGWNDVPYDHELTAVFKDWFERFGAVPALISSDVIEFWVENPIEDPAVAAKLAMEMYILCPDSVDQGTDTTEALANCLLGAKVWSFWWD